jgi:hypothetical protein
MLRLKSCGSTCYLSRINFSNRLEMKSHFAGSGFCIWPSLDATPIMFSQTFFHYNNFSVYTNNLDTFLLKVTGTGTFLTIFQIWGWSRAGFISDVGSDSTQIARIRQHCPDARKKTGPGCPDPDINPLHCNDNINFIYLFHNSWTVLILCIKWGLAIYCMACLIWGLP